MYGLFLGEIIHYPQIQTHQCHHPSHLRLLKNMEE